MSSFLFSKISKWPNQTNLLIPWLEIRSMTNSMARSSSIQRTERYQKGWLTALNAHLSGLCTVHTWSSIRVAINSIIVDLALQVENQLRSLVMGYTFASVLPVNVILFYSFLLQSSSYLLSFFFSMLLTLQRLMSIQVIVGRRDMQLSINSYKQLERYAFLCTAFICIYLHCAHSKGRHSHALKGRQVYWFLLTQWLFRPCTYLKVIVVLRYVLSSAWSHCKIFSVVDLYAEVYVN